MSISELQQCLAQWAEYRSDEDTRAAPVEKHELVNTVKYDISVKSSSHPI